MAAIRTRRRAVVYYNVTKDGGGALYCLKALILTRGLRGSRGRRALSRTTTPFLAVQLNTTITIITRLIMTQTDVTLYIVIGLDPIHRFVVIFGRALIRTI